MSDDDENSSNNLGGFAGFEEITDQLAHRITIRHNNTALQIETEAALGAERIGEPTRTNLAGGYWGYRLRRID
jgi:hypothetical protein